MNYDYWIEQLKTLRAALHAQGKIEQDLHGLSMLSRSEIALKQVVVRLGVLKKIEEGEDEAR